ncbi:unnamed protein product [marine sediment metagenome]|uniref:Agglutinin C-terminal domain-containing protein n=1 Tax=marine sediment metagenome TaxID=412755 RepID=X1BEK3_9ZZZZ
MSKLRVEHIKSFKEYRLYIDELRPKLRAIESAVELYLWDYYYWYISLEDWGKVFEDVLLNQPKYVSDKFDCEDFAMLTTARVLEKYRLNTCGVVVGQSPFGEHGYNLFIARVDDKAELFILEPQDGMIYPVTEPEGYKPRIIILG